MLQLGGAAQDLQCVSCKEEHRLLGGVDVFRIDTGSGRPTNNTAVHSSAARLRSSSLHYRTSLCQPRSKRTPQIYASTMQ